ncbi:MAG: tRNA (adenosine(37)-N6)-threonylcarbamoyltransferase complex dimerization subunit type 1 TsaB [Clostridia bacterium]|nr:tRNA (adenosine(37)-N6)-threonylcarbamoyltransferase complex dimerization subunit type 1 TsaB [Clostridia bacterium]
MKNFLAIDTANEYLTVLAVKGEKVCFSYIPDCSMRHSVTLMPEIDKLLDGAGMRLSDFDFFSAVVGAGSFTGIRIGISAVKGFCLATEKPCIPVTSFDLMAYNKVGAMGKRLCLVNALHDCYYACGYDENGICYPPAYLTESEVLELCKEGYALFALTDLPIAQRAKVEIVEPKDGLLNAVRYLEEGGKFGELTALYVRKSSAELNATAK